MANNRPVLLVDKITGEVVARYDSAYQAGKENPDWNKWTISNMARKHTLGYRRHVWRFQDEYKRRESFEGHRVNVPLELYCDGRYMYVSNLTEAAKAVGCLRDSVCLAIKSGEPVKGVYVRYLRFMGDFDEQSIKGRC